MEIENALKELKSETNVKFRRLVLIAAHFFGAPRINGSHHVFKTPWRGKPFVNLQKDGSKAKVYQVAQVKEALIKLKDVQKENDNETYQGI
jgi:hypothetical protein